jgi:hypothetical protein
MRAFAKRQRRYPGESRAFFHRKNTVPVPGAFFPAAANLQAKLQVNEPGDRFEQEADNMANAFVQRAPQSAGVGAQADAQLQRRCAECERESDEVRMSPASAPNPGIAQGRANDAARAVSGDGRALPAAVRQPFEQHFGQDLSQVQLHTDAATGAAARRINARAYTLGEHIGFAPGEYAPETQRGRHLLAHELTHTLQQRGNQVLRRYSTTDCNETQRGIIRSAVARARAMLNRAIARLTASPVSAATQTLFANHFGAWAGWRRDVVVAHLRRDLSLLGDDDLVFQCESECDADDRAYTYWVFGDIHLCPNWLNDGNLNEQAETAIHEVHHWDLLRGHLDLGYHENNSDADTIWIVAVNNADAYSELAQDLYEQP